MRTFWNLLIALYLGLHALVFVFHPLSGPFLALSHVLLPAGIVDNRPVWYPRIAEFAHIAKEDDPSMKKRDAVELGLQEAVYEARVKNVLRQTRVPFPEKAEGDALAGVFALSRAANAGVFASDELQEDVKNRLLALRSRIVDGGMPFTDAALRYSEDSSAKLNGDLGIVSLKKAPEWMAPVFSLTAKSVSDVLNAPSMEWLLMPTAINKDGNEVISARVYGIALQKKELPAVITKQAKGNRPWIFIW